MEIALDLEYEPAEIELKITDQYKQGSHSDRLFLFALMGEILTASKNLYFHEALFLPKATTNLI